MAKKSAKHSAASAGKKGPSGRARTASAKDAGKREASRTRGRVTLGLGIALMAVATPVASAYATGVWYFQDHYLPNTYLNGTDVSLMSVDEVARSIDDSVGDYTNTIIAGDFSYTVTAADIGLSSDGAACAEEAFSGVDAWTWPSHLGQSQDLTVSEGITYDAQRLEDLVSQAVDSYNESALAPQDATVGYDEESGEYVVNSEVEGTRVQKDVIVQSAIQSVDAMARRSEVDDAGVGASVTSDDESLQRAAEEANAILSQEIGLYDSAGNLVATAGHDQIASWVTLGEDYSVSVDYDAAYSWVAANATSAVPANDDDYTYSLDASSTASALTASVRSGASEAVYVQVAKVAKPRTVTSDSGAPSGTYDASMGSYIEIDLSNQYARYYSSSGDVLWESYIVSGNTSEGRSTPTGTYSINSKATNVTLVGLDEDKDGEPDYRSEVSYWMPFVGNSIGLHDATWRSSFGGSIYATSGSHGCVNLPYAKAQALYGILTVGTTVYVHY